ncbi:MAG: AAA family ATPase [Oscillospiraceae bacterium]|jgi:DNA helicase IV|nr:AAA family ATPase [Oscillospiraceae bacterium]
MTDSRVWKEETAYLSGVTEALQTELTGISRRFERGITAADEAAEESVRQMLERRYRLLRRAEGSPYFARVDYTEKAKEKIRIYIGKASVYDADSGLLVTDWRAPVSGLYYDGRLGPASYDSPDGTVEGDLSLKRRLTVEGGELRGYDDIDVTADDALLAPYLSVSADTRLKDIIATIQAGQNKIIRADPRRPLIVQGAAGSGKTTVALHRIAYLTYNMGKRFRPEQFLVLTSGSFFLSYIAGILPDLGVEDVPQLSFEELARRYVKTPLRLHEPVETPGQDGGYKSTYEILSDIDAFLAAEAERKRSGAMPLYKRFLAQAGYTEPRLTEEDLAPLLYLRIRASGLSEPAVRHVVIDEAQDFSAMQLTVLQTLFKKASFTILGDLAQGIGVSGVKDWDDANRQVWQGTATVLYLQKSYRVTIEIMEAANRVLDRLPHLPKGSAVVRHGESVGYIDVWGENDRADACVKLIEKRRAQGHINIAVLVSKPSLCKGFARLLRSVEDLCVFPSKDGRYEGGVCLLPAALSKGLEFDSVIVADADRYSKDGLGTKLLYVAMTRAMHTLDVLYEGEPPF